MQTQRAKRVRAASRWLLVIAATGFSLPALAVCAGVPLEAELKAAKTVFVATITESKLTGAATALKHGQSYRIDHAFVVRERLKGDPASVRRVYTTSVYNDPASDTVVQLSESIYLFPGESVLVMSEGEDAVQVSLCGPSKKRHSVGLDLDKVRRLLRTK